MKIPKLKLISDLKLFANNHFKDRPYFVCNYGSYASDINNEKSDIDIFFATENILPEDLKTIHNFVIDYHKKNDLHLDDEVPYDNKLLTNYYDVSQAANLKGLEFIDGHWKVPTVTKDRDFLSSISIRYRLIYNALTSPHQFVGNDQSTYEQHRETAEIFLLLLARDLSHSDSEQYLLNVLLEGPDGERGEFWLGYKKNHSTISWLRKIIQERLHNLSSVI